MICLVHLIIFLVFMMVKQLTMILHHKLFQVVIKLQLYFKDWFVQQNLPWDYTDFSGRSDYGPFLAEGIVAGGLFSGADDMKTQEQRDRYDQMLGQGLGGIAGIDS